MNTTFKKHTKLIGDILMYVILALFLAAMFGVFGCSQDPDLGLPVQNIDLAQSADMARAPDMTQLALVTVFRDQASPDSQAVPEGATNFRVMRYGMRVYGNVDAHIVGYVFGLSGINKEANIQELHRAVGATQTCTNLVFRGNTVRCTLPAPRVIPAGTIGFADLFASFAAMSAGTYVFEVADVLFESGGTATGLPVKSNQFTVVK